MNKNLLLFILIILTIMPVLGQDFDHQKMDDYMNLLQKHNKFMGSVNIYKNGKTTYSNAVGWRDIESQLANDTSTLFRIGSITKMFTATIIFRLIEDEKLTLKDRLSDFFPEIENAKKITVQNLLNHSSGLANFTASSNYMQYMNREQSPQEMLEKIMSLPPDFSPGEKHEYSNTNYLLLGYIIEKITGIAYHEALRQIITEPLDLQQTRIGGKIDAEANQAFSYRFMGSWFSLPETDMSIPHGAGAIISTASDLNHFVRSLFKGEIISEQSLDQMIEMNDGYGHGIFEYAFKDKDGYGHGGGIDGFVSFLTYFPENDISIAILSNGLNYNMDLVFISLLKIYFGEEYQLPDFEVKGIQLSELESQKFTGVFASEQLPLKMTISLQGQQLYAQPSGQSAFPLTAIANHKFVFEMAGIEIEFISENDTINFDKFTLKQAGNRYEYSRKNDQ